MERFEKKKQCKIQFISKFEKAMKRMRRKALELTLNSNNNTETYGFQSIRCPPAVKELSNFENDCVLLSCHVRVSR